MSGHVFCYELKINTSWESEKQLKGSSAESRGVRWMLASSTGALQLQPRGSMHGQMGEQEKREPWNKITWKRACFSISSHRENRSFFCLQFYVFNPYIYTDTVFIIFVCLHVCLCETTVRLYWARVSVVIDSWFSLCGIDDWLKSDADWEFLPQLTAVLTD